MNTRRNMVAGVAALGMLTLAAEGGASLRLAFEDRDDLNPRQMALGMQVAGLCLGLAITWSERAPRI